MKKNFKRYAAIAGVVLLLVVFCMPMVFAFGSSGESQTLFRGALAAAFLVPVLAYIFLIVYQMLNKRKPQQEEERMIENIIFDVGQVLMAFEWEKYLKGFGFPDEKYEKIADATFRSSVWDERDRGCFEEEEYLRQFCALAPEYEADIREVLRRSDETLSCFPYAPTWVKYLKSQGYHLYILSNYSDYMLKKTRKDMSFLKYMDGVVFSCEVKELKPEEGIYRKLLDTYHLNSEKSVFLDDRAANCEGARKLGIHAIQFESFKQAAAELEKYGVK